MLNDAQMGRLNELAKKAKVGPLSPEEAEERQALRRAYIEAVKQSLAPQLESIRFVEKDGRITRPDGREDPEVIPPTQRSTGPGPWPEGPGGWAPRAGLDDAHD